MPLQVVQKVSPFLFHMSWFFSIAITIENVGEKLCLIRGLYKKWDSSPCRVCHKDPQPSSDEAEIEHKKMETEGATCIDCHPNLVHEEEDEE